MVRPAALWAGILHILAAPTRHVRIGAFFWRIKCYNSTSYLEAGCRAWRRTPSSDFERRPMDSERTVWQFETPTVIKSGTRTIEFKNRMVRSSLGGRMAYYDGTANNAWKNFEYHFAQHGMAGIISATISVNPRRHSPLEYPQIDNDKFMGPLSEGVEAVKKFN